MYEIQFAGKTTYVRVTSRWQQFKFFFRRMKIRLINFLAAFYLRKLVSIARESREQQIWISNQLGKTCLDLQEELEVEAVKMIVRPELLQVATAQSKFDRELSYDEAPGWARTAGNFELTPEEMTKVRFADPGPDLPWHVRADFVRKEIPNVAGLNREYIVRQVIGPSPEEIEEEKRKDEDVRLSGWNK